MTSLTDNATTIEIKGSLYAVDPIPAGPFGVAAARLTKMVNGEIYDVLLDHDGHASCDCPDYELRRKGTGQLCKALSEAVLLLAPVSGGSPAVAVPPPAEIASEITGVSKVAPITRKDLVRSIDFGIRLPVAPMEADRVHLRHLPQMIPTPAIRSEIEADEDESSCGPAGDSWEGWQDEARWELGPEVGPGDSARSEIDLTSFASRTTALEVDSLPVVPGRFEPSRVEHAEQLGFELGLAGEDGECDSTRSTPAFHAFLGGWLAGCRERWAREEQAGRDRILRDHQERAEFEAWLDSLPAVLPCHEEPVEAGVAAGHPSFES